MDEQQAAKELGEKNLVVFIVRRDTRCAECDEELAGGSFIRVEKDRALCVDCADLGHLEFLASGDAALTRRASKYSPLHAVVVQWSRSRKRYERRGTLVVAEAIAKAEAECAGDEKMRAMRRMIAVEKRQQQDQEYIWAFAAAVRRLFPGCPRGEENGIAQHACEKYSGRVGRSASAKELDEKKVRLAVIAHIRHVHTRYDELLGVYGDRDMARMEIRGRLDEVLERWERT
jgi:hypothetical protein